MKKFFVSSLAFLLVHMYLFLAFAFSSKTLDFLLWTETARVFCMIGSVIGGSLAVGLINMEWEN